MLRRGVHHGIDLITIVFDTEGIEFEQLQSGRFSRRGYDQGEKEVAPPTLRQPRHVHVRRHHALHTDRLHRIQRKSQLFHAKSGPS